MGSSYVLATDSPHEIMLPHNLLLALVLPWLAATLPAMPGPTRTIDRPMTCNTDTLQLATPTGALQGSLVCPVSPGPWPVVLIIAGSGPTDRDGNSALLPGHNNSLRMLAEALAAHGIASLRYDKRGLGASRGAMTSEADLRFDMFAADAEGWARELKSDARFSTLTVAGHSEGSLLGMLAAQHAGADAYVSIAGIGRPASQVLHEQLAAGAPAELLAEADRVMAQLEQGHTVDNAPPALAALFRPSVQPYMISWFRYDPLAELRRLHGPVLIVQGTTDIQVPVKDARLLASAVPAAKLVIVDGMNHVLKLVPTDQNAQLRSYSDPALPVAPALVEAMTAFVQGVRRR